jgi:hypothetical protein
MPRNQSEKAKPFGAFEAGWNGHMHAHVDDLVGHTLTAIENCKAGSEAVTFVFGDASFLMYHNQDCCEDVRLDDVAGDIENLVGTPLTMSEVVADDHFENAHPDRDEHSYTWTFYKFATIKGYVTLRWYGTSNGYYSEEVSFDRIR